MFNATQEAYDLNKNVMYFKGVYKRINKGVKKVKENHDKRETFKPLKYAVPPRDFDQDDRFDYSVFEQSPSKNILNHKKGMQVKEKSVKKEIQTGKVHEMHFKEATSMNELFKNTNFELDDFYLLKKEKDIDLKMREQKAMDKGKVFVVSNELDSPFYLPEIQKPEPNKFDNRFPANKVPKMTYQGEVEPEFTIPRLHTVTDLRELEDFGSENFGALRTVLKLKVGNSILNGARHLYNDNWIIDFLELTTDYRNSVKTNPDPFQEIVWNNVLSVREQDINSRLNSLEPPDLINVVSGKITEEHLYSEIYGNKLLKDESEMDMLLNEVDRATDEVIMLLDKEDQRKIDKINESKARAAAAAISSSVNSTSKKAELGKKLAEALISKPQAPVQQAGPVVQNLDAFSNFKLMNERGENDYTLMAEFGADNWRNQTVVQEVIRKLDGEISQK